MRSWLTSVQGRLTVLAALILVFTLVAFVGVQQLKDGGTLHRINYELLRDIAALERGRTTMTVGAGATPAALRAAAARAQTLADTAETCTDLTGGAFAAVILGLAGTGQIPENCRRIAQYAQAMGALLTAPPAAADGPRFDARLSALTDDLVRQAEALDAPVDRLNGAIATIGYILILAVGTLAAATGFVTARSISRPLRRLNQVTRAFSAGNFDVEVTDCDRRDEIGDFARGLAAFRQADQDRRQLSQESAEQAQAQRRLEQEAEAAKRQKTAEEQQAALARLEESQARTERLSVLIASFDAKVAQALGEAGAAMEGLQSSAESLRQMSEQTMTTVSSAASASRNNAERVQEAAQSAGRLAGSIESITERQEQADTAFGGAAARTKEALDAVQAFVAGTERIGDATLLISSIARQTNMLALNATVEAARAGEAGKGFAVVAKEVKTLARQSAEATAKIDDMIRDLQAASDRVQTAVDAIGRTISAVQDLSAETVGAMRAQSAETGQILHAVDEASEDSGLVRNNLDEVCDRTGQVQQEVARMRSAVEAVRAQNALLDREIGAFLEDVKQV